MNKEKNIKKAYIWNIIGSLCYSGSSFLYLLVVTRICGEERAGFFSLSFATAQLLLTVGRYGMRTYQSTDLNHVYSFREYCISRWMSCVLMFLLGVAYSAFSFKKEYIIISCFVILLKVVDAVEDVYHGNFQQGYCVEIMGKSLAARNAFTVVLFVAVLLVTKELYITCVIASIGALLFALAVNQYLTHKHLIESLSVNAGVSMSHIFRLLKQCTPLFVSTFLSLLLYNIPKYAMSAVMTDEFQTRYSVLFMPSFVITMICEFAFKPIITTMASVWMEGQIKKFISYIVRIFGSIIVCTILIVTLGHTIGRMILELIYGIELKPYDGDFMILLTGGGICSCVYMLYNILIAIRESKCIIFVYSIVAVITAAAAKVMVVKWGLTGAALNYLFSCTLLFVTFVIAFLIIIRKKIRNEKVGA